MGLIFGNTNPVNPMMSRIPWLECFYEMDGHIMMKNRRRKMKITFSQARKKREERALTIKEIAIALVFIANLAFTVSVILHSL